MELEADDIYKGEQPDIAIRLAHTAFLELRKFCQGFSTFDLLPTFPDMTQIIQITFCRITRGLLDFLEV